jgi:hypothetical protein
VNRVKAAYSRNAAWIKPAGERVSASECSFSLVPFASLGAPCLAFFARRGSLTTASIFNVILGQARRSVTTEREPKDLCTLKFLNPNHLDGTEFKQAALWYFCRACCLNGALAAVFHH